MKRAMLAISGLLVLAAALMLWMLHRGRFMNLATSPVPRSWSQEWSRRHQFLVQQAQQRQARILFIGDSITELWEREGRETWDRLWKPLEAMNLGIGGDRTENVLWRVQNGALGGLRPELVVLLIGTNNSGHQDMMFKEHWMAYYHSPPTSTAAGVQAILVELKKRLPGVRVLLLGILPCGDPPENPVRVQNAETSRLLAGLADGAEVFFKDLGDVLTREDGRLDAAAYIDGVHLSAEGYRRLSAGLEPVVRGLLQARP